MFNLLNCLGVLILELDVLDFNFFFVILLVVLICVGNFLVFYFLFERWE